MEAKWKKGIFLMLRFDQIQMETIFTSEASKNFLGRLKRQTGIPTWNVVCRLAFCHSLKDKTLPRNIDEELNGVEMNYDTFAGKHKALYLGLLIQNLVNNKIINDDLEIAYQVLKSIIIAEEHKTLNIKNGG